MRIQMHCMWIQRVPYTLQAQRQRVPYTSQTETLPTKGIFAYLQI